MKQPIIVAVKTYRKWISPALPASCRFIPTCSEYALEAIETHGTFKGTALFVTRILRCQPLTRGGLDPVPAARERKAV